MKSEGIPQEEESDQGESAERDYTFVPPEKQIELDASSSDREKAEILLADSKAYKVLSASLLGAAGIGAVFGQPGSAIPAVAGAITYGKSLMNKAKSNDAQERSDRHEQNSIDADHQTRGIVADELLRTGATVEKGKLTATDEQIELARKEMDEIFKKIQNK